MAWLVGACQRSGDQTFNVSQDNAACEGFFGRLKTEFFYPRDWRAFTVAQFISAVDAYIHWYNETRIKLSLGGRSPIEYRKSLGLMP